MTNDPKGKQRDDTTIGKVDIVLSAEPTFTTEQIIRTARKSTPALGTFKSVKEAIGGDDVLQVLRENLVTTIATSDDDGEFAKLMGMTHLLETAKKVNKNEPSFKISTAVITQNPDRFAAANPVSEMKKEYVYQLGQFGVTKKLAEKQFEADADSLMSLMGTLVVRPKLREQVAREAVEYDASVAARKAARKTAPNPVNLVRTRDVLSALADTLPAEDAQEVRKTIEVIEKQLAKVPTNEPRR